MFYFILFVCAIVVALGIIDSLYSMNKDNYPE